MDKMNKLAVYRVEYEIPTRKEEWKAFIAGYSPEECIEYLESLVGGVNVRTVGLECRLDAITDQLRKTIVDNTKVVRVEEKRKEIKPKGQKSIIKKN